MSKFISLVLSLLLLVTYSTCKSVSFNQPPVVTTSYGQIMGTQDTNANMFLGIPYAEAPVGNLRWHEPFDKKPWRPNVLDASDYKPSCPQAACNPLAACPNIVFNFF